MKHLRLHYVLTAILVFSIHPLLAQDNSLSNQFTSILSESESYESYKVIRTSKLLKFKSSMLDSLFDYKQQIVQLDKELLDLKKEVDQLRISFEQNQKALAVSEAKNEVIGFLWFEVNKEYYQFFVWSFMAALLAIVLILYFRIKHVCAVVKRVKAAYSKIMDEYRMQRHQSIEKQIKLKREIQTIQNRLEMIQSLEESSSS